MFLQIDQKLLQDVENCTIWNKNLTPFGYTDIDAFW